MNAVEFNAQIHNGIVQIPPYYSAWENKQVKVILLESEKNHAEKISFNAAKIKTKGYRFNREEANER